MSTTWQAALACLGLPLCAAVPAQAVPPQQTDGERTSAEKPYYYWSLDTAHPVLTVLPGQPLERRLQL